MTTPLPPQSDTPVPTDSSTLIPGHAPDQKEVQFTIGPYQIVESIGTGGMGEVFLAYDTTCGRRIALKRIRPDLKSHRQLHNRFLKEARITSQLTHPAVIPIYTIHSDENLLYYTMPYVEGKTLRQILSLAKEQEAQGLKQDHASSIPSLTRLFLSICQAVAYAHSKGVVHRDLKPNNIMIGRYGEVFILDWGLAKLLNHPPEEPLIIAHDNSLPSSSEATRMGRVVGTVTYMAPERALGNPATCQTDVYSLGVILYQILTLHLPFYRRSLKEFREKMEREVLTEPAELAPYRDVPPVLARITATCLAPSIQDRYRTVDDLIHDIESYLEGRSEWFRVAKLDIHNKADWEFQENILLAQHTAITRGTDVSDWVILMIAKDSYPDNTKLEAQVKIGAEGQGIGFMLNVPAVSESGHLNNGYCLWIGSDLNKSTKLLRSGVEVVYNPDTALARDQWFKIRIEKIDNNLHFYLNDLLQFSYFGYLPLSGTHVGLLARDADFTIKDFSLSVGSQNSKVNCLAVPDAFLANKDYTVALTEYRRIGQAFPGTAEGREALFRAGITLLEKARHCGNSDEHLQRCESALDEFSKLHDTPGAPLEYLGKALVYQELKDPGEESKCFELALRRYPKHPLLPLLQEQLIHRMHETSRYDRRATYQFALLTIQHQVLSVTGNKASNLFLSLKRHWESLYFIDDSETEQFPERLQNLQFAIVLAFWLARAHTLEEIIEELLRDYTSYPSVLCHALFALLELGDIPFAQTQLNEICNRADAEPFQLLQTMLRDPFEVLTLFPSHLKLSHTRIILYLMDSFLEQHKVIEVQQLAEKLAPFQISSQNQLQIDCRRVWAYLLAKEWEKAGQLLHTYPIEALTQETSLLYFLYGCWLYRTEGKEIANIHFSAILSVTYPRSWTLFSHYLHAPESDRKKWLQNAFLWEKKQLYRQCALFYHCAGDEKQVAHYLQLAQHQVT